MLLIHHWDTDGITSAAILIKVLKIDNFLNLSPPIGEYSFDSRIWKYIEKSEKIYVLDFNVPHELEKIKDKEVIFFDHHIQKKINNPHVIQINPLLKGKSSPSTTIVISEYFNHWDAYSALGAVGDLGKKAFEISLVNKLLKQENISKKEALMIVQLIDSNYIVMDKNWVEKAVNVLLNYEIKEILEYDPWIKNVENIEKTINDIIGNIDVRENIAFVEFKSSYNVISKVARKVVWEMGYKGAVVVNKNFHGKAQIYFRISPELAKKIDMYEIIQELKNRKFNAGGKKEVLGCICKKSEIDDVLDIIKNYLISNVQMEK
ncbi:phosphoesterase RecJ domain protein [Methanocaldococcus infernus ME]|uniref:Phosphoesterase RecJ domain protein n=1 Tax=Methanocaldococcus infernus (strain DSM 11812 / JCM 15783 / ME) TaxID=573063 RepID=D5VU62_METIM|nr:DHH family phosphoesterase [Methanocaldococcus infernus]ADG12674.1 phosphoesterase RecJ domain protein [Methanocaldococcus infernus ME]